MKHYSPQTLHRAAKVWSAHSRDERDMVEHIRSLVITDGKPRVAFRLGISELRLTAILRGKGRVDDKIAAALDYRRVVRFELIS